MVGTLTFAKALGLVPASSPESSGSAPNGLERGLTSLMGPYPRSDPIYLMHNWYFRVPGFPNA